MTTHPDQLAARGTTSAVRAQSGVAVRLRLVGVDADAESAWIRARLVRISGLHAAVCAHGIWHRVERAGQDVGLELRVDRPSGELETTAWIEWVRPAIDDSTDDWVGVRLCADDRRSEVDAWGELEAALAID